MYKRIRSLFSQNGKHKGEERERRDKGEKRRKGEKKGDGISFLHYSFSGYLCKNEIKAHLLHLPPSTLFCSLFYFHSVYFDDS